MADPSRIVTQADLAAGLDELRDGRSYHKLAAAAGLGVATVQAWVKGASLPRRSNLIMLLKACGVLDTDPWVAALSRVRAVAAELNGRPRKTLGWDTPAERLAKLLDEANSRPCCDDS